MVFGRKKKTPDPETRQIAAPRPGSIGEHVAGGGKLPGEEGFDVKAVEADVAQRKQQPKQEPIKAEEAPKAAETSPSGWQNVKDVFQIALNPFSEDKIVATSRNKVFNSVAEFVANHPYTTALTIATGGKILTGALGRRALTKGQWIKAIIKTRGGDPARLKALTEGELGKIVTKEAAMKITGKTATGALAGQVASNTATRKLTGNALVKSGFTLIAASYIIKEAVETYPFAKFEIAEAMDKIGYARSEARRNGREDLVEGLDQLQEEILNPEGWEKFASMMPWANIQRAAARNIYTAIHATQIYSKIDEVDAVGGTEDEKWERVRQEQAEQEKANIDYYNSERKKMLDFEREAKKEARNADAEFWRKERANQRQREKEDREAIAKFWEEYRKKKQLIADNNRPSNLNFGLI